MSLNRNLSGDSTTVVNVPNDETEASRPHKTILVEHALSSRRIILAIILWYLSSFVTLFLNKFILAYRDGDPTFLALTEMLTAAACGFVQMNLHEAWNQDLHKEVKRPSVVSKALQKPTIILGSLRFFVVFLGVISINWVAVSFAETVKSSAPIFTVLISAVVLKERSSFLVILSLIPIMLGLALCSANELSFTLVGFIAALLNNITECAQFVYSKTILSSSSSQVRMNALEVEFSTALAAAFVEIPVCLFFMNYEKVLAMSPVVFGACVFNGVAFYTQSIIAWYIMSNMSPVTHAVLNTVKRALAIWLSVLIFHNSVTAGAWIGTALVIIGVFLYNHARRTSAAASK